MPRKDRGEHDRAAYADLKAAGVCPRCGRSRSGGYILCRRCRKMQADSKRAARRRLREAGRCPHCKAKLK